jgi:hypothetical protein
MYASTYHQCADSHLTFLTRFDGTSIVQRSIDIGEPIIYVSLNYRYVLLLVWLCDLTDSF